MTILHRLVPWLGRLVLLTATVIFVLIGLRYLADPVGAARATHISFASAAGATSMRVGFGAFPLAFATILALCLLSARRRLFGLGMVATIMGLATGARVLGLTLDGTAPESSKLLAPEIVMTALALFCLLFEWNARRAAPVRSVDENSSARSLARPALDRWRRRVGTTLVVGVALMLAGSAVAKLVGVPAVATQLGALGFAGLLPLLGVLELAGAALVAFPITRPVGLLLTSAFLGGAIATHVQHAMSPIAPSVPLAALWVGTWLRHPDMARLDDREVRHADQRLAEAKASVRIAPIARNRLGEG